MEVGTRFRESTNRRFRMMVDEDDRSVSAHTLVVSWLSTTLGYSEITRYIEQMLAIDRSGSAYHKSHICQISKCRILIVVGGGEVKVEVEVEYLHELG